ncbi:MULTISPECIES: hypothetical protein [unclassified Herbaspirillum]|uniref:hypothetical protein n=1 Tax=unclassified Herbaspirillum TaxID=2624150 RepID=UPI001154BA45|nr:MULTISPECIES: hypothetical protein [unclassified Herbaspirillum]MBB5392392.1 hypothetical protein [Herbaspirillum sp. SJZ102]TQK06032.1 hypothetical protein FB599_2175 [Herbaspirillum sp. SJZ130]TQK12490.1 hypothetical protein FB598_2445 [Herbaspirillum sp. SJZ106]
MKRLWVLLLICLFPVQVFAAVLTYASSVAATDFSAPVQIELNVAAKHLGAQTVALADHAAADLPQPGAVAEADNGGANDDSNGYADSGEDFSTHAGIGDEPVLIQSLAVLPEPSSLAPALRSDDASQPPFLPLAGRPPRA